MAEPCLPPEPLLLLLGILFLYQNPLHSPECILFQAGGSIRPCCPHHSSTHHCPVARVPRLRALWGRGQSSFTRFPVLRAQAPEPCGGQSCRAFVIINLRASDPGLLVRPLGPRPSHSSPLLITNRECRGHTALRRDWAAAQSGQSGGWDDKDISSSYLFGFSKLSNEQA